MPCGPGRQVALLRDIEARLAAAPHWPPPPPAGCSEPARNRNSETDSGDVRAGGRRSPARIWDGVGGFDSYYGADSEYGTGGGWDDFLF